MPPTLDDVSYMLEALFSAPPKSLTFPIKSKDLLRLLIAQDSIKEKEYSLKLTHRELLDDSLEALSKQWDHGTLSLDYAKGELLVTDVTLSSIGRKRKRSFGDDGSSAQGGNAVDESTEGTKSQLQTLYSLLRLGTTRSKLLAEQFHSDYSHKFEPICDHITKDECSRSRQAAGFPSGYCEKIHFRPIIRPHTDPSLGHCSYLNTCYSEPSYALSPSIGPPPARPSGSVYLPSGLGAGGRGKEKAPCRYLHFEVDYDGGDDGKSARPHAKRRKVADEDRLNIGFGPGGKGSAKLLPPQWINCDLRRFDYSVLGKFHVIMADPPWDIHMSLPYGTMTDDEMRAMPIPMLQDEGLLFLWVTGRAMEVGRECLRVWGYTRVDEIIWVKTNQLQRVIRTGRTGHWLNHTKEHLLVGVKAPVDADGNIQWPAWINRGLDTDVIVSEVRETSRKPDEVYGLIERMCPGGRKIEIFGRKHNARPGWLTLGNQLGNDKIHEADLHERLVTRYPERYSAMEGIIAGPS